MSVAGLVLAVAVLVAPGPARHRIAVPAAERRVRVPASAFAVLGCAVSALWLPPTAVAASAVLAATLSFRRRCRRRAAERTRDTETLQGALDLLVGELRVGAHPVMALSAAAAESCGRVAESLQTVAARARLGADVAAGLRVEGVRSASPAHWDRLAACWELAHTQGLAIATLVEAAQRDIAERHRFRGRVEAGLAGVRATAAVLAGLPVVGLLLGQAVGADPLRFLIEEPLGGWLLLIGALFICAGLLWSDRLIAGVLA
ncbi:type II secretion system F family protein [Mycobacterium sp. pV006]|uniref:type II secretion system F family protein n=1 Tax=Mycobacterium sp. pV006 TaxID=3238983 RepID=UPI00351BAF3B